MKSRSRKKVSVKQSQSSAEPTRREFLKKSSVTAAGVLASLALPSVAHAGSKGNVLALNLDKTVLVCVTGNVPTGELAQVTLDEAYQQWIDSATGLDGFVRSLLLELHDPMESPQKVMFALIFEGEPNGLAAAQAYKELAYEGFKTHLVAQGFTDISDQLSFLYADGEQPGGG